MASPAVPGAAMFALASPRETPKASAAADNKENTANGAAELQSSGSVRASRPAGWRRSEARLRGVCTPRVAHGLTRVTRAARPRS